MCKKAKGLHNRIDPCMKNLIEFVKAMNWRTVACCCGHGRYPITIVVRGTYGIPSTPFELLSRVYIPRGTKFYKKDSKGFYYIPEVSNESKR